MVELGQRVYRGQVGGAACAGCHGDRGQGSPLAPDLTGKKWLWSDGSLEGLAKTITEGVPQPKQYRSPMPPMGGAQLDADQIKALAAYIWSISHAVTGNSKTASAWREIPIPGSDPDGALSATVAANTAYVLDRQLRLTSGVPGAPPPIKAHEWGR